MLAEIKKYTQATIRKKLDLLYQLLYRHHQLNSVIFQADGVHFSAQFYPITLDTQETT